MQRKKRTNATLKISIFANWLDFDIFIAETYRKYSIGCLFTWLSKREQWLATNISSERFYALHVQICDKLVHITDNHAKDAFYKVKNL